MKWKQTIEQWGTQQREKKIGEENAPQRIKKTKTSLLKKSHWHRRQLKSEIESLIIVAGKKWFGKCVSEKK